MFCVSGTMYVLRMSFVLGSLGKRRNSRKGISIILSDDTVRHNFIHPLRAIANYSWEKQINKNCWLHCITVTAGQPRHLLDGWTLWHTCSPVNSYTDWMIFAVEVEVVFSALSIVTVSWYKLEKWKLCSAYGSEGAFIIKGEPTQRSVCKYEWI